jgi:hypothetical protein
MAHVVYDNLKTGLLDGTLNFLNDNIYCLLIQETNPTIVTSATLLVDTMSTEYSGSTTTPLTETSGINYTAGGKQLTNLETKKVGSVICLSASNVEWNSSTITAGGLLLYKNNGIPYTSGTPLIYMDFSAKRTSKNDNFTVIWSSEGIIEMST